jgi:hypothetical protein
MEMRFMDDFIEFIKAAEEQLKDYPSEESKAFEILLNAFWKFSKGLKGSIMEADFDQVILNMAILGRQFFPELEKDPGYVVKQTAVARDSRAAIINRCLEKLKSHGYSCGPLCKAYDSGFAADSTESKNHDTEVKEYLKFKGLMKLLSTYLQGLSVDYLRIAFDSIWFIMRDFLKRYYAEINEKYKDYLFISDAAPTLSIKLHDQVDAINRCNPHLK